MKFGGAKMKKEVAYLTKEAFKIFNKLKLRISHQSWIPENFVSQIKGLIKGYRENKKITKGRNEQNVFVISSWVQIMTYFHQPHKCLMGHWLSLPGAFTDVFPVMGQDFSSVVSTGSSVDTNFRLLIEDIWGICWFPKSQFCQGLLWKAVSPRCWEVPKLLGSAMTGLVTTWDVKGWCAINLRSSLILR